MMNIRFSMTALALLLSIPASIRAQDSLTTAPSAEPVIEAPAATETAPASDHVARATFCRTVEDHEPIDRLDRVSAEAGEIYYFTEIVGLEGQTITHRWLRDGQTMAEVPIEIGGPRWRVYSTKNVMPSSDGEWTVQVVGADGAVLQESTVKVGAAAAATTVEQGS